MELNFWELREWLQLAKADERKLIWMVNQWRKWEVTGRGFMEEIGGFEVWPTRESIKVRRIKGR